MDASERTEYLTFFVRRAEYAIRLSRVREVVAFETVTRIPHLPPALRGVTNLRGQVVPVLDLAIKFHGAEIVVDARTCVVIVETVIDGVLTTLGLITDTVGQVLAVTEGDVMPPPSFGAPIRTEFLAGMVRIGTRFALLLEIDHLLSRDELLSTRLAEPITVAEEVKRL